MIEEPRQSFGTSGVGPSSHKTLRRHFSRRDALLESQTALQTDLRQILTSTIILQQDLAAANKTIADADAQLTLFGFDLAE